MVRLQHKSFLIVAATAAVISITSVTVSCSGYATDQGATRIRRLCSDHHDQRPLMPQHIRAICDLLVHDGSDNATTTAATPDKPDGPMPPSTDAPVVTPTTVGLCHILCSQDPPQGGALCDCGNMPPAIEEINANPVPPSFDQTLEHHARSYNANPVPPSFDQTLEHRARSYNANPVPPSYGQTLKHDARVGKPLAPHYNPNPVPPSYDHTLDSVTDNGPTPVNCTILCSTGDGGAVCDCGDMPPLMMANDPAPVNCTVLCSSGDGGAACDCGDMPPAFEEVRSAAVRRHTPRRPISCSRLCAILSEDQAPRHCGCHHRWNQPKLKSPLPRPPPVGAADDNAHKMLAAPTTNLCDTLCAQGTGGSLCDCQGVLPNLPPALFAPPQPQQPSSAAATEIPPLPINPVINCYVLCDTGMGGSLCRCGDMPPAAAPPSGQ